MDCYDHSQGISLIWFLPILGALLSRLHGSSIEIPKVLKTFLWALPFGIAFIILSYSNIILCLYGAPLVVAGCMVGKATGYGRGFRLYEPMADGDKPEKIEFLILPLYNRIPLYWYKVLIMTLAGIAAVSGAVVGFSLINPLYGLVMLIAGAFKGINAMIFDQDNIKRELADGFVAYLGLAICLHSI